MEKNDRTQSVPAKKSLRAQFAFSGGASQTHTHTRCSFFRNLRQLPSVEFPAHSSSVLLGHTPSSYKSKKGAAVVGGGGLRLVAFADAFRPRPAAPSRGLRIKSESDWPILVMHIFCSPLDFRSREHSHNEQWSRSTHVIYAARNKKDGASHLICALRAPM
jgi:hypothetical protein